MTLSLDADGSSLVWGWGSEGDYSFAGCVLDTLRISDDDVLATSTTGVDSVLVRISSGAGTLAWGGLSGGVIAEWFSADSLMLRAMPSGQPVDMSAALAGVRLVPSAGGMYELEVRAWAAPQQERAVHARLWVFEGPRPFSLGVSVQECAADSVVLSVPDSALYPVGDSVWGLWQWSGGSEDSVLVVYESGVYALAVWLDSSQSCVWVDSVWVGFGMDVWTHETVTGCAGDTLWFGTEGVTTDTSWCTSQNSWTGCDSVHCVDVVFMPGGWVMQDSVICSGDSVWWGGSWHGQSGLYADTLIGWNGCDSVRLLSLEVLAVDTTEVWVDLCAGQSYEVAGDTIGQAGTYVYELSGWSGCDSVLEVVVSVSPPYEVFHDTTICAGESVWFGGMWIGESGVYVDTLLDAEGCEYVSSLMLEVVPLPEVWAGVWADTCSGTARLTGATTGDTLWWSTGQGVDTLLVMESGTYTLYGATQEGCMEDTSLVVSVPAPLAVWWMVEDERCAGSGDGRVWVTDYEGGVPPVRFWLDGQLSPSGEWTGVSAGYYELRAADSVGCEWTEWIEVGRGDSVVVVAGPDTSIFSGGVVRLWVWSDPPADSVQWLPSQWLDCGGCSEVTAMPESSTTWTVQVWDERGCRGSDTVRVEVVEWREAVVAPNVFSPNGDGVNDYFGLYGTVEGEVLRLEVYDRWGELVYAGSGFRLNEPGTGWDGRHRGKPAATDVYVWQAMVRLGDGRVVRLHGDVTLLR